MANGPLACFLVKVCWSFTTFNGIIVESCDEYYGEVDISTNAQEVKQCSCEQLAYNR